MSNLCRRVNKSISLLKEPEKQRIIKFTDDYIPSYSYLLKRTAAESTAVAIYNPALQIVEANAVTVRLFSGLSGTVECKSVNKCEVFVSSLESRGEAAHRVRQICSQSI